MPELYGIIMYAAILGIIVLLVRRLFDLVRGSAKDRKEIIERLDRIERRLDELQTRV